MDVNGYIGSGFYLLEDRIQIWQGVNDCLVRSLRLWFCLETTGKIRDMKWFTCFSSLEDVHRRPRCAISNLE